jgi:hypothetical protein
MSADGNRRRDWKVADPIHTDIPLGEVEEPQNDVFSKQRY